MVYQNYYYVFIIINHNGYHHLILMLLKAFLFKCLILCVTVCFSFIHNSICLMGVLGGEVKKPHATNNSYLVSFIIIIIIKYEPYKKLLIFHDLKLVCLFVSFFFLLHITTPNILKRITTTTKTNQSISTLISNIIINNLIR